MLGQATMTIQSATFTILLSLIAGAYVGALWHVVTL
jgi:hypothetical protein